MLGNFIWTNHARDRLRDRKILLKFINQTLIHPDKIVQKNDRTIVYQKYIDGKTFAALIKKNNSDEKIIVSCWVNPPFPGTKDYKKRQRYFEKQKASPWKKLWLTLLDHLGL